MAPVPSIKGSVFAGLVERVAKLAARGVVSEGELAGRLEPEDVALLGQEIVVSGWYDIRAYDRLNALLLDVEGEGDFEYYREQGRHTAQRLLDAGLYAQLEYLQRAEVARQTDPQARFEAFGRDLRLLTSLSGSILNFSRWSAKPDPENGQRYVIEVSEAGDMPESLCWRSDGFVNGMAAMHGQGDLWSWTRPRRDLVVFRMLRPA
jgi:hypothetical protein